MSTLLELPIFPLNTVLFPGGLLPLRIFEQRYLDMTKECIRSSTAFGVCRIREGLEVGVPAIPEEIGCTADIREWEMPHLGMFHLVTQGAQPFRILEHTTQNNGLIRAKIELLEEISGEENAAIVSFCRQVLEQAIQRLGSENFPPPLDYANPRWVSYRLAEVLPLPAEDKQSLLEQREDAARLELLHALLERHAVA
ncbi:MAG: LON peptidase substrate-binding domain-containing protein [Burkholderiales bacterium]